jgi:hypothetical protein
LVWQRVEGVLASLPKGTELQPRIRKAKWKCFHNHCDLTLYYTVRIL